MKPARKKSSDKGEETGIVVPQRASSLVMVTQADVDELKKQRQLLRAFISTELKEADFSDSKAKNYGEGDYGIIPGTKKRCLFKQGAEKILTLFHLGADPEL